MTAGESPKWSKANWVKLLRTYCQHTIGKSCKKLYWHSKYMIKVLIKKQSNCPVSSLKIRKLLVDFFTKQGVVSDAVVSVSIVGEKTMLDLARKFLGEKNVLHNVLSFNESETRGNFIYPSGDILYLGEIVLCYPKIFQEAKDEGVLIDQKVEDLIEHAGWHLMGIHHD